MFGSPSPFDPQQFGRRDDGEGAVGPSNPGASFRMKVEQQVIDRGVPSHCRDGTVELLGRFGPARPNRGGTVGQRQDVKSVKFIQKRRRQSAAVRRLAGFHLHRGSRQAEVGGKSLGKRLTFRPMPTTVPRRRSTRMPPSSRPATSKSLGHLIRQSKRTRSAAGRREPRPTKRPGTPGWPTPPAGIATARTTATALAEPTRSGPAGRARPSAVRRRPPGPRWPRRPRRPPRCDSRRWCWRFRRERRLGRRPPAARGPAGQPGRAARQVGRS